METSKSYGNSEMEKAIFHILNSEEIHPEIKRVLLQQELIYFRSGTKYHRDKRNSTMNEWNYWTQEAIEQFKMNPSKQAFKNIVGDHLVPRNIIVKDLLDNPPLTIEALSEYLDKYLVIIAVTKNDQDQKLNKSYRTETTQDWKENPFKRYLLSGVIENFDELQQEAPLPKRGWRSSPSHTKRDS